MFVQDIGSKEDTELNGQGLTLSWRELSVETPDTVSLLEIGRFFRSGALGRQRIRRGYAGRYYRFYVTLSN